MDDAPNAQQRTPFLYPPGYQGSPKSGSQVSEDGGRPNALNPSINVADSFESADRPGLALNESRENSVDNGTTLDTTQSSSKSRGQGNFNQKRVEETQSAGDTSVDSTNVQAHLNKSSNSKYSEEFRPAVDADVYRQGSDVSDYMESRRKKSETQKQAKEATEKCMKMIEKSQVKQLRKFLKEKLPEDVKVSDLVDLDGFTLLHMAVFKNKTPIVKELVKIAKEDIYQYEIAEWINKKTTKDQFTALHYASFRGNVDLLDLLLANGADMEARNLFGLNVLHIAAQGDQPISIYYFKQKKMDLTSTDKRGSTPLHWACFQNSEIALIFILGWIKQSKMSLQDIDGFTPLHLAIKSSEQIKSGRPMRALLMKGANKDARDKKGRRPLDLIDDIKDEKLQAELRQGLQDEGKCDCLMLRTQMKKTEKSLSMPFAFLMFYDSTFAILMLFLFPVWEQEWQVYLNLLLGIVTMTFWFISQFSDPGFIQRPRQVDFLKLMQIVDPIQLCPDCLVVRTPRSRHCNTCNQCVERYDHHCPWINNCVGVNNHRYFIFFLSSLWISNVLVFISSIVGLLYLYELPKLKKNQLFYDFLPESLALEKWVYEMASLVVIVLTGFFVLPIGFLFYIQIRNFLTNKTTNERFSRKKPPRRRREPNELRMDSTGSSLMSTTSSMIVDDIINDLGDPEDFYAGGCLGCHNCTQMLCTKPFPSQLEMYNKFISSREALHKQVSGLDISEEAGSGGSLQKKKTDPAKPKRSKSYGT